MITLTVFLKYIDCVNVGPYMPWLNVFVCITQRTTLGSRYAPGIQLKELGLHTSPLSAKVSCRPTLTAFLTVSSLHKNWRVKRPGDFYV